jgi:hypothetical protein
MTIERESTTANIQKNLDLLEGLQKARESLLPFTLFTKPDYRPNWHHAELAIPAFVVPRS